jgi:hypothetical protein
MICHYFKKGFELGGKEVEAISIPFNLLILIREDKITLDYNPSHLEEMTLYMMENKRIVEKNIKKGSIVRLDVPDFEIRNYLKQFREIDGEVSMYEKRCLGKEIARVIIGEINGE